MSELNPENIAIIMMATEGGRMSPALYGIPMDRVEEFLTQPETEGNVRGHSWFLCYMSLIDYCNDFKTNYVLYREDTGRQDEVLERLFIPKYNIEELITLIGRKGKNEKSKK